MCIKLNKNERNIWNEEWHSYLINDIIIIMMLPISSVIITITQYIHKLHAINRIRLRKCAHTHTLLSTALQLQCDIFDWKPSTFILVVWCYQEGWSSSNWLLKNWVLSHSCLIGWCVYGRRIYVKYIYIWINIYKYMCIYVIYM